LKHSNMTTSEQEILEKIGRKILKGDGLDEIISHIYPDIREIIPCDRFDAGLLEENGRRLVMRIVKSEYDPFHLSAGYAADVSGSFIQQAVDTRSPVIYISNEQPGESDSEFLSLLAAEGITACVIVPVVSGIGVIGTLTCSCRGGGPYVERHGRLLEKIASLLRYTVEKAYQSDQIEKHYQAYKEMLGFVSHELKSPITSIITMMRTMADGYYGPIEEKQLDVVRRAIKKAEYLDAMSTQYLNLSRFESNALVLKRQLVDFIDDIVESSIELIMQQVEERNMKLERDFQGTIFPVYCDPGLIKIVMLNLLNNAIKYGNKKGRLVITIRKLFKMFSLSVWNEGPGFSETEKSRLFKKFSRLETKTLIERKGSGIGLYLSWKIVQLHGGRILAESMQGSWARFTVELPQYMDFRIAE
jgi:signal transduction histidine kinase